MLWQLLLRFALGGLIVSAFAVIGHIVRPKTFSGIFGAAPSVSLATLGLAYLQKGPMYAATEGRSMIAGAVALGVYSWFVSFALLRREWNTVLTTVLSWGLWAAIAFAIWGGALRGR